jgi:hypothetical protein
VIVFDEFFNYPGWEDGEYRAWEDHVKNTGWRYCYEAFTVDNEQVVIRLTDVDSVSMVGDYAADAAIVHHQFDPEPALDDTVAGGNGQMTENADK